MTTNPKLQALYRKFETFHCKGLCQIECTCVPFSPSEARAAGVEPRHITDSIATNNTLESVGLRAKCEHLSPMGACNIYENRPFICRAYGAIRKLYCNFGCQPIIADKEGIPMINQYNRILEEEFRKEERNGMAKNRKI